MNIPIGLNASVLYLTKNLAQSLLALYKGCYAYKIIQKREHIEKQNKQLLKKNNFSDLQED
uniref:Uncharacterized protein n=1 Tax=Rhizophagus irregularis (strain DAOM 181602 / DAOM 197198 / MUCL 43194) TaxID=747089 RepID=U9TVR8_RHIID